MNGCGRVLGEFVSGCGWVDSCVCKSVAECVRNELVWVTVCVNDWVYLT